MRLLKYEEDGELTITRFVGDVIPPYAILSHTWRTDAQEVTFADLVRSDGKHKPNYTKKLGYEKIQFCGQQSRKDALQYFWVDTCCIDKSTSDELSTAINSMFRWYQGASKCYVYLSDVSVSDDILDAQAFPIAWRENFRQSRWFTRGWTLQELLAPASVEFFSKQCKRLGSRVSLEQEIHDITKIPTAALRGQSLSDFSVDDRSGWAARRTTTVKEDKVYCLLGIFGVFLPLIYGEGEENATLRLREEIRKRQPKTPKSREEYEKFLRSISYPEMEYRFHNVDDVEDDTCSWLLHHSNYQKWCNEPESSSLLMIRGKPGSGKSTAMKRACKLAEEARANGFVIAFFFNSRGVAMETKLEGFYRSALHQLLKRHGSTMDDAFTEWERKNSMIKPGWEWTVKELQDMFVKYVVRSTVTITIFVDALDECESPSAAQGLLDLLTDRNHYHDSDPPRLRICVSSRHYPNVRIAKPLQITVEETNQGDILQYVRMTLQGTHIDRNEEFATEIASRSNGMFLWAILVIEKIREALFDGEPREELQAIIDRTPLHLEEVFKSLVDGIAIRDRERSNRMLSWILFAKRPITLTELHHALAFWSGSKFQTFSAYEKSDSFVQPDNMRALLTKYTRGLVEAVKVEEWDYRRLKTSVARVQFIHESVRQYMLSGQAVITSNSGADWSNAGFVNDFLARSCFNYIKAVCSEQRVIDDILEQLETTPFHPGQLCKHHTNNRPFLEYAIQFGFSHAKAADESGLSPSYLIQLPLDGTTGSAHWWNAFTSVFKLYWKRGYHGGYYTSNDKHWSQSTTSQIAFACAYKLSSWVDYLLEHDQSHLDSAVLSEALCVAVSSGYQKYIARLIEAGADVNYEDRNLENPLYLSLLLGRDEIVAILLKHGATVHIGSRKYSPLVTAVLHRPVEIVRALLAAGAELAEFEPEKKTSPRTITWLRGTHALQAATRRHIEMLEALLSHAERQRVPIEYYKDAFFVAANLGERSLRKRRHTQSLEAAIIRLFPGNITISVYVKTLTGKTMLLQVWEDTKLSTLKDLIRSIEGYPTDHVFVLVYGNKILRDDQTLRNYDIQPEGFLQILPKARWIGPKYAQNLRAPSPDPFTQMLPHVRRRNRRERNFGG